MHTLRTKDKYPKIYTIEQGGLRVESYEEKNLPSEKHIAFEQIKRDKFYHVERPTLLILSGGIFFFILILVTVTSSYKENPNHYTVLFILGFLTVLSLISYFSNQQRFYFVKTFSGNFIKFRIKNNAEEIKQFVQTLITCRDKYLKENYGTPNRYFSYDAQFSNFQIMHREGILSSEELQDNLKALNNLFDQKEPRNIFSGYSKN